MKAILKDILIPIDFSNTALNALNTGINIARRHQSTLHLLYVNDIMAYYPRIGDLGALQPMAEEVLQKDIDLLGKMAFNIITEHYVDCRLHCATGNRDLIVKEWVAEHGADLVIVGTESDIAGDSYLFDGLAYQLLRSSPSHVMAVPANRSIGEFHHILYPIHSTGAPMSKYPMTRQIAEKNKAEVSVLGLIEKSDAELLNVLNRMSQRVKARLTQKVRSVKARQVFTKNKVRTLTEICREQATDLVVIEAETHRNIKEYFFGNFTQKMLRNQEAAVLCLNPAQL